MTPQITTQRLAPQQISTALPLEAAREATWRALAQLGLSDVLIDRDKNVVAGAKNAGLHSNGETVSAAFSESAGATLIDVRVQPHLGGSHFFGSLKRRTKKMTDAIEVALVNSDVSSAPPNQSAFGGVLPIAAPTGESSYALGAPVYGTVMPAKRGGLIMIYAVAGLVFLHILSPFAWFYAHKTLKDYGDLDPGDKKQVKLGRTLGIVGTVILVGIWGAQLFFYTR